MSYLHTIAKEFLTGIKDSQERHIWNEKIGNKISNETFFSSVFRNNLSKKYKRVFAVNRDGRKHYACDNLETFLKKQERFTYFTPQIFYTFKTRRKEDLSYLTSFVLDFDLKKDGTERDFNHNELVNIVNNEIGLEPHFCYGTKTPGNYNVVYLIKEVKANVNTIYLYEAILKRLSILLGSDFAATASCQIFRIPKGDIYSYKSIMDIYDIDDFKIILEDEDINDRLDDIRHDYLSSNVISMNEYQIMNLTSVKMLLNCDVDEFRNHCCFTLALLFYSLGKPESYAEEFFENDWFKKANNSKFEKRFTYREMKDSIKSAYSGKYCGPSREWIEFLTGEVFPINLYRSTYIKKSEKDRLYLSKNTLRARLIYWVGKNLGKDTKQKNLAGILDVSLRSLKRNIKELKDENILEVETTKGRNSTSKFYLKNNHFTVEKVVNDEFVLRHKIG